MDCARSSAASLEGASERGEEQEERCRWSSFPSREREQSTSREQSTTLLSLFLLLFLKTTPYLAERVAGDLLRQALVEEGAAVSLFALVEEIGREREA